jgi:hypothetical protein
VLLVFSGGATCFYEGHTYFEWRIGLTQNIHFFRTLLEYFTYHWVPVLAPNCKQYIFSSAKPRGLHGAGPGPQAGNTHNIRVRVGPNSTYIKFGFEYGSGSTGIFRAFSGHLSPKKKWFVFTRNSWHSQKISAQSDLSLLVLQSRTARGLGIPDWCQREEKTYTMISWPLLTYSVWYYIPVDLLCNARSMHDTLHTIRTAVIFLNQFSQCSLMSHSETFK